MKTAALVLVSLLFLVAPAVSQTPDAQLIVPGARIGKWTLQMTVDDLVRMNGPAQVGQIWEGVAGVGAADFRDTNWFHWERQDLMAFTFFRQNVEALSVGWLAIINYKTAKGVGVRSTRSEIVAAYGKPTVEIMPWEGQTRLIYDKIGISFVVLNGGGEIRTIQVFRPGTAKNIWKF